MPITCPYCSREFKGDSINARHKAICEGWPKSPPPPPCLCGHEATSQTQLKRHRAKCNVWKSRDRKAHQAAQLKATMLERHGVENPRHLEEAEEKRKATVRERYGADNVFAKESSVFDKVQASLEGKRPVLMGEANPFAKPEVQEKIREHWQREHGVDNPQQVPAIRAQTEATNQGRYGGTLLGSPELAEKARTTNLERYGDEFPQRTEAVKERTQETNLERWGVPWTCMDPEVRARQLETHHERYGSHWFASEEGKEAIRQVCLDKYGVDHWMKTPGAWEKLVAVFQERFGVDHPLQLAEFLGKQRDTLIDRYGTPFPGLMNRGMNGLETQVFNLVPEGSLLFTGDGSWWRHLPLLGRNKNPDFIAPGPDPVKPQKEVTKVVEAFGDYWHSRILTGKAPFAHEQELVDAYAEIGIECLVIWESEVEKNPEDVRGRLSSFLGGRS